MVTGLRAPVLCGAIAPARQAGATPNEETAMSQALPESASAVVIGGGVTGTSVAYHLAKLGWSDVVLLERRQFASGTSWHAAGLIGTARHSDTHAGLCAYTRNLLPELEAETGQSTGFRQVGSVTIAHSRDRFAELKRMADSYNAFGFGRMEVITAEEVGHFHPWCAPTTCSGHLARDRRNGEPGRCRRRLREGRPGTRRALHREREGHRHPYRERPGVRGRNRRRRHRLRVRGVRGGPVVAPSRAPGRSDDSAARVRALLRPHREACRPAAQPSGAAGSGQVRLLPRGRRQSAGRRVRTRGTANPARCNPGGFLLRRTPRSHGRTAHAGPRRRDGARAPAPRGRLAEFLLRPGKLHSRRPVPCGRVPRTRQLLRRVRPEFGRHRNLRRDRKGLRGVDGQGSPAPRPHRQRPAPGVHLPGLAGLYRGAGIGNPRAALRPALPVPPVRLFARCKAFAGARAARRARRMLRGGGGVGAAELVCTRRRRAPLRVRLLPPELVRVLRGRASCGARGRRPVRPIELLQVPRQGS